MSSPLKFQNHRHDLQCLQAHQISLFKVWISQGHEGMDQFTCKERGFQEGCLFNFPLIFHRETNVCILEYVMNGRMQEQQDDDPFVRKTAAIVVAKLYDINTELVEDGGFLESLKDLISHENPMVVANVIAALVEIQEIVTDPFLRSLVIHSRSLILL